MYDRILQSFKFKDSNVLNVFPYGSRVYGTNTEKSDYDFVVVLKNLETDSDRLDAPDEPISITTYTQESFQDRVNQHKLSVLECLFCPEDLVLKSTVRFDFKLNLSALRASVSEKCSKDWNQAKKRFSDSQGWNPVTNQPYVRKVYEAKKSLFHCFRMLDFATQIIQQGKIVRFSSCNDLWEEIVTDPADTWEPYRAKYYEQYNNKLIEFRKLAPK